MAITVAELLAEPQLGLSLLAGSAGLGNRITWAHTSDLPRLWEWVTGGELMMTNGLSIPADPEGQVELAEALVNAGASALAIGEQMHAPSSILSSSKPVTACRCRSSASPTRFRSSPSPVRSLSLRCLRSPADCARRPVFMTCCGWRGHLRATGSVWSRASKPNSTPASSWLIDGAFMPGIPEASRCRRTYGRNLNR